MRIDLHMHSNRSDGSDTPQGILQKVREAGLDLFSLTDHDGMAGSEEIRQIMAAEKEGGTETGGEIRFVNGVEFSCRVGEEKYHILGYDYDAENPAIVELVDKAHQLRMKKARARVDFVRDEFGFVLPEEDVAWFLALNEPGKPHLGNLLAKHGYAEDKDKAIKKYINKLKFTEYLPPEEAIAGILAAGGIPILAHPSFGDGDQRITGEAMEQRLQLLMTFGLQGLEAYYSGFDDALTEELLTLAERYDLYVTAGSDYHGTNKTVVLGDTHLPETENPAEEWPRGLPAFLEAIGIDV